MESRFTVVASVILAAAGVSSAWADETFDAHRALWDGEAVADYEYRYQKVCVCHLEQPADTIVTVSGGEITQVRYAHENYLDDIPVPSEKIAWFRTVEDLFGLVERALEDAATVRVSYDAELGFPVRIYIDYDANLVGEEIELHVVEFTAAS